MLAALINVANGQCKFKKIHLTNTSAVEFLSFSCGGSGARSDCARS
jgi:hypothetical protein